MENTKKLVALVLLAFLFGFSSVALAADDDSFSVSADTTTGSAADVVDLFSSADSVNLEKQERGSEIEPGSSIAHHIGEVEPGRQLQVIGTGSSADGVSGDEMNYIQFALYTSEGVLLSKHQNLADGIKKLSVYYYPGKETSESVADDIYLVVSANSEFKEAVDSYEFTASIVNRYDADTDSDAGETTSSGPILLTEGSYKKNQIGVNPCGSTKFCSTDGADTFKYEARSASKLTFTITPSKDLILKLVLKSPSGEVLANEVGSREGEEVEASTTVNEEGMYYFTVSPSTLSEIKFGQYEITISEEKIEVAPVEEMTEEKSQITSIVDRLKDNMMIVYLGAGVGVLILVAIIILVVLRIKRGAKPKKLKGTNADVTSKVRDKISQGEGRDLSNAFQGRSMNEDLKQLKKQSNQSKEQTQKEAPKLDELSAKLNSIPSKREKELNDVLNGTGEVKETRGINKKNDIQKPN